MKFNNRYLIANLAATALLLSSCNSARSSSDSNINGWSLRGANPEAFQSGIDKSVTHLSTASAFISSKTQDNSKWSTLMQEIKSTPYKGKRVRFSAWVKTENAAQWSGLWMRVDKDKEFIGFDNMEERPIKGTTEWKQYDVVLDVDTSSTNIAFGLLLIGTGKTWMDNVKIETVSNTVPVTGISHSVKGSMSNLSFEKISPDNTPLGWGGTMKNEGYKITSDHSVFHDSLTSACLENDEHTGKPLDGFGTITGGMDPASYFGKRVRMSGWIKTENVTGWAGLWMRVDGQNEGEILAFDNMYGNNRSITGTTDWKKYDVVLDVPKEASNINFGALLTGNGKIWLDEVKFEVVGNDVPSTSTYTTKGESASNGKEKSNYAPRTQTIYDSVVNTNFEN